MKWKRTVQFCNTMKKNHTEEFNFCSKKILFYVHNITSSIVSTSSEPNKQAPYCLCCYQCKGIVNRSDFCPAGGETKALKAKLNVDSLTTGQKFFLDPKYSDPQRILSFSPHTACSGNLRHFNVLLMLKGSFIL